MITKLFSLHDHRVVHMVHCIVRLRKIDQWMSNARSTVRSHRILNISHGMVDSGSDNTDQLPTNVDRLRACPLVVVPIPLLRAMLHLCHVVGSQGQRLETTTSSYGTSRDKVVQRERVEGPGSTPRTLHGLVDHFSQRVNAVGIVASGPCILDVVSHLELLEALRVSIVDILGVGNKLGRRGRSIGSRHFEWRTG